jgi:ABC-type branched-subunit amino acid transport system ATPase component/MFS family permease
MTDVAAPGAGPSDGPVGVPDGDGGAAPMGDKRPHRPDVPGLMNGLRHPIRRMQSLTGDGPLYALVILFGLNAVDELDRSAFGILAPDIAADFGIGLGGITVVVFLAYAVALGLTVPIATLADRGNRVGLALGGGLVLAVFSVGIGAAGTIWVLGAMLAGSQVGKAVIDPTHNSLLADWYSMDIRPRIYSFHRAANSVGQFIGPISAGLLATWLGWRAPFIIFAIPTLIIVILGLRLRDPVRGARERRAMGASEEAIATEEEPPSFAEAWRMCWKIDSLRRIYRTLPFLAPALAGFLLFASFYYEEVFGLDAVQRGFVGSATEPFQLVGLIVGARIGMKMFAKDPSTMFRFLGWVVGIITVGAAVFALAPNIVVALVANIVITSCLAFLIPGIFAALSLAIPARARSMGFSMGSVFVLPGLALIPVIGVIGQVWGLRVGMLAMVPMFLVGGLAIASAGKFIRRDIENVWTASAALSEVAAQRRQGNSKRLLVRNLEVAYGDVQVLFGVDLEVDDGEIVALLGTNGAGKSTLLKAISGVVEADKGAVILDGRDVTHAPPNEIAARGVIQVPGGQGVFPSLTVLENLRTAGWLLRGDRRQVDSRLAQVFAAFPVLERRSDEPAANLSGGQQQMLALGMALVQGPKLVLIDELSLGLAPVVVEQLVPMVRAMRDDGATVIVVEQSVNVALTLADEAYFMEKGQIRFHGPTAELLDRPDVLRSVFLEGASSGMALRSGQSDGAQADGAQADGTQADVRYADVRGGGLGATTSPVIVQQTSASQSNGSGHETAMDANELAALEVSAVSRRFGGILAVEEVSLSVAPGEVLGIIGPNGAGKTTLFDLISGFVPVDSGTVLLAGSDVTRVSPGGRATLGLGRSFQDARLFPGLTVEDTIKVSLDRWTAVRDPVLAALHMPAVFDSEADVAQRTDELIELLGLQAFRSKFVRELSTGSRRIVDLGCIMAHRPSVVLFDEPSSGIAQRETEALAPIISRVAADLGAAVVVIEHDMPLVGAVADRLVALDQGRVVTGGSVDYVLHHPEVVASYLGTTRETIERSGDRHDAGSNHPQTGSPP